MIESKDENLRNVIERLIELIKNDLRGLNHLLQYTDPFALQQKYDDVSLKRERCTTLLKLLQNVLASEMKIDGKPSHVVTSEKAKAADKIMTLLRNYRFIESSELAQYLQGTITASKDGTNNNTRGVSENLDEKRVPKSIKKLKKVYDRGRQSK